MLIQQLHELLGHKELGGFGAQESFLHLVVVLFLPQPGSQRAGETQLGLVVHALGKVALGGSTQGDLLAVVAGAILGGNGQGQLQHLAIQEGNAQLQAVGHGHAVGLQDDVVNHPGLNVHVLQLGHAVQASHFVVIGLGVFLGRGHANLVPQVLLAVFVFKHVVGAAVALPGLHGAVGQEVLALHGRHGACDGTRQSAQELGVFGLIASQVVFLGVVGIATKKFVGAFAGKHYLHMLGRVLAQEVQGVLRRVGQGLIQVVLDIWHGVKEIVSVNFVGNIGSAQFLRETLSVRQLAVLLFLIAHAKGANIGSTCENTLSHKAGVNAGRKEAAHLNVGNQVRLHAVGKHGLNAVGPLFQAQALVNLVFKLIVAGGLNGTRGLIPGEIAGGGQLVHALEQGELVGQVLVAQVGGNLLTHNFLHKTRVVQKALDFGTEHELAALVVVVEGLDAEDVASAKQLLGLGVPDDEGEHAAQAIQHATAPLFVAVENSLGVRMGGEHVTSGKQFLAQLLVVVDFAIEHNDLGTVFVFHRLATALQVDDGQAPMGKRHVLVDEVARAIGTAMGNAIAHELSDTLGVFDQVSYCKTGKTAHIFTFARAGSKPPFTYTFPSGYGRERRIPARSAKPARSEHPQWERHRSARARARKKAPCSPR